MDKIRRVERQSVRPVVFTTRKVEDKRRTRYELWSVSKESVQAEIAFITAHVESQGNGGEAHFVGPCKFDGIWKAVGRVVIYK
jgi:hypothetical protein